MCLSIGRTAGGGLTFVSKYSSHFVHTKRMGEESGRGEASSPFSLSLFLSNGGLTLVQRRVSFGEKWHERSEGEGRVKENTVKEKEDGERGNQ